MLSYLNQVEKKQGKLAPLIQALQAKMAKDDYQTKVPEKVRTANTTKLEAMSKEQTALQDAICSFKALQLED